MSQVPYRQCYAARLKSKKTASRQYGLDTGMVPGTFNPIAPRKAKIAHKFGLSECNRIKFRLMGY